MREDPYTGSPLGDDDDLDLLAADVDLLYEFDPDDEALINEYDDLADNEQVIHFGEIANGAKTLQDAASRLYDFADELFAMSEDGWEIVDDVTNCHATAVRFGVEDEDSP